MEHICFIDDSLCRECGGPDWKRGKCDWCGNPEDVREHGRTLRLCAGCRDLYDQRKPEPWKYCPGCQVHTPSHEGVCLICSGRVK